MIRNLSTGLICWLLMMSACASLAAEQSLGKLFFTPSERSRLNDLRKNSRPPEKLVKIGENTDEAPEQAPIPVEMKPVSVQGYIKRNDGPNTIWVNGQPVLEKSSTKELQIGKVSQDKVPLKYSATDETLTLKPGQSYDPNDGVVSDALNQRQNIKRALLKSIPASTSRASTNNDKASIQFPKPE